MPWSQAASIISSLQAESVEPQSSTTLWAPQPGPQEAAFACAADQIGYGGAAGGGKTDLGLGLSCRKHQRSIIFRRTFPSVRGIIERSRQLFARGMSHAKDSYNEQLHLWRLSDGRTIEFGSLQREEDKRKHQGQARGLIVFDEATEFSESQIRFVTAWNRSADGGPCQVLLTFNPPMDDAQGWIVRYFAPWLDAEYADKAADGEIRAVVMGERGEIFYRLDAVPAGVSFITRTFFRASLDDNPILAATGYRARLEALPEPLRSYLLHGDFAVQAGSNPWQVVPSDWVRAAVARWTDEQPGGSPTAAGLDVARGGLDETVKARLYGSWVAPFVTVPGAATTTGGAAAALVLDEMLAGVPVGIDVIGVGAAAYDAAAVDHTAVAAINFASAARDSANEPFTDRTGVLRFLNLRAYGYWLLRESLDPALPDPLALPDDPMLLAEIKAPRWSLTPRGVQIEPKDAITERLGRSPDRADALVVALLAPLFAGRPLLLWDGDDGDD